MRPTWRPLPLLLVPPLLLACGPEEGPGGPGGTGGTGESSVEDRVAALPGVEDVSVADDVTEEDGAAVTEVVVTLEPDPDVEEVAAVLTELADADAEDPLLTATYVGGGGSYRTGAQAGVSAVRDVDAEDDVEEAAALFVAGLALAESLGGEAATDVDYDPEVDNDASGLSVTVVPASDSRDDVYAAVTAVADDPALSGAGALVVGQPTF